MIENFLAYLLCTSLKKTPAPSPHSRRVSSCVWRGDCTFFSFEGNFWFLCLIGLGVLLDGTNGNYRVTCCGVIDAWEFYVKDNPGTVDLQVWRSTGGGSYTLVGKNSWTVNGRIFCLSMDSVWSSILFLYVYNLSWKKFKRMIYMCIFFKKTRMCDIFEQRFILL